MHEWLPSNAPRRPPPPPMDPPPPPSPPRNCLTGCDNSYKCGMCLVALESNSADCPATEPPKCSAANADSIALGSLCESDGECGGGIEGYMRGSNGEGGAWTGNCPSSHCPTGFDIYRNIECYMPPSAPPQAPASCSVCDNDMMCDSCLTLVENEACPLNTQDAYDLQDCAGAQSMVPGELCRHQSSVCGTSWGDNCKVPYTNEAGGTSYWNMNVYKKVVCHQPASPPPAPPRPPPPSAPPAAPPGEPGESPAPGAGCPFGLYFDKYNWCQYVNDFHCSMTWYQDKCAFSCNALGSNCHDKWTNCHDYQDKCSQPACDGTKETCNSKWPNSQWWDRWCTTCYDIQGASVAEECPFTCWNALNAKTSAGVKAKHLNRKSSTGAGALQAE